jgi:hypothetical protein
VELRHPSPLECWLDLVGNCQKIGYKKRNTVKLMVEKLLIKNKSEDGDGRIIGQGQSRPKKNLAKNKVDLVKHICNPSYSGGRSRRIHCNPRQTPGKKM